MVSFGDRLPNRVPDSSPSLPPRPPRAKVTPGVWKKTHAGDGESSAVGGDGDGEGDGDGDGED